MKTITNIFEWFWILVLVAATCMFISSCMTAEHTAVPQKIKDQFGWEELSLDNKDMLQAKYGGLKAYGTGQVDKQADGSFHIDTTAKLEVLGGAFDSGLGHLSGIAKAAAGAR